MKKIKEVFISHLNKFSKDPYGLRAHVQEMERWADYLCLKNVKADRVVVRFSVWLHDIGHYPIPTKIDHAVRSEKIARVVLNDYKLTDSQVKNILHCIRAHRCKDVMPETLEAKIIACADSASHMTDNLYMVMAMDDTGSSRALGKLERDYRDISIFPEIKKKLHPLYMAWKKLLVEYDKINLS